MNLELLRRCLPELAPHAWEKFQRYGELLERVALPRGLIGFDPARIPGQIVRSLALLQVIGKPSSVIDVGSGAGLPGMPLAIALGGLELRARRSTTVVLVEPKRRAVSFLERTVRELDLEVEVVAEPAEKVGRGPLRESGGAVVARALAPLAVAAELCAPLVAVGGVVVVTGPVQDPSHSPLSLDRLGLEAPRRMLLSPIREIEQRVHIMSKIATTSRFYPRRPGLARRRPLW